MSHLLGSVHNTQREMSWKYYGLGNITDQRNITF